MENSIKSQSNDKALNNTNIKLANSSNAVITKRNYLEFTCILYILLCLLLLDGL